VLKKSKSCAEFVAEIAKKLGKVALKLRAIWLIFGCKILHWSFGTLADVYKRATKLIPGLSKNRT